MHLTAVVPGSLVPAELAAELTASLQTPALARVLRHSTMMSQQNSSPGLADVTWVAREVYRVPPPAPTAPYAWAALTGSRQAQSQIWHADPVHVAIGRDSLIVQDLANATPSDAEADALIAAANESLRAAGCAVQRAGEDWFLLADRDWEMAPRPLSAVLGQAMPVVAPDSDDALRWSRMHNEIQMLWHDHPVNQARDAGGLPAVNALWLHGGGRWQPRAALRWSHVHSQRADLQGVATAAGAQSAGPDDSPTGNALLIWDDVLAAAHDADWSGWIVAMQSIDRRLAGLPPSATLELVLTGRQRIRVWLARPSDRVVFWRRTSLDQALAE